MRLLAASIGVCFGALSVIAGVAMLSIPAAFIVVGVCVAGVSLLLDFDSLGRRRK